MKRIWLTIGSLSMLLALVIAAATGHSPEVDPDQARRQALETARELHLAHSIALLLVGQLSGADQANRYWHMAGAAFLIGIVLFPGGIYLNRLLDVAILRPLVPVGGAALMLGWLCFTMAALRTKSP